MIVICELIAQYAMYADGTGFVMATKEYIILFRNWDLNHLRDYLCNFQNVRVGLTPKDAHGNCLFMPTENINC